MCSTNSIVFLSDYSNPYPTTIFLSRKCCLLFAYVAYMHFRVDEFIEANHMNPDQTVPNLGQYCLRVHIGLEST